MRLVIVNERYKGGGEGDRMRSRVCFSRGFRSSKLGRACDRVACAAQLHRRFAASTHACHSKITVLNAGKVNDSECGPEVGTACFGTPFGGDRYARMATVTRLVGGVAVGWQRGFEQAAAVATGQYREQLAAVRVECDDRVRIAGSAAANEVDLRFRKHGGKRREEARSGARC